MEALRVDPSRIPPVDTDAHLTNPTQILEILPNMITIYSQCYENDLYSNEIRLVRHQYGIAGPEENKLAHLRKYHHGTVHLQEIKLAHFSVKEFLLSGMTEKCEATPLLNSVELNECFMTEACLYYMLFYEESKHKARSEKDLFSFPLLAYACQYWSDHWACKFVLHSVESRQSVLFIINNLNNSELTGTLQSSRNITKVTNRWNNHLRRRVSCSNFLL